MRLVIDHVVGARRGQRQELALPARVRFGRHPDCEVAFDPHRDLDASARHAELRPAGQRWLLLDLGSSNGTFINQHRATETPMDADVSYRVRFGTAGPEVQLTIAADDAEVAAPALQPRRWARPLVVGLLVAGAAAGVAVAGYLMTS